MSCGNAGSGRRTRRIARKTSSCDGFLKTLAKPMNPRLSGASCYSRYGTRRENTENEHTERRPILLSSSKKSFETATDAPQSLQLSCRLRPQSAPRARGGCRHTSFARAASQRRLLASRRWEASRFFEQIRPYLFPGDDIGGIFLKTLDPRI